MGVIELVRAGYLSDENVLRPVVKNLFGHAAEIIEDADMAIQKGRQIAPIDELKVEPPRKAENHRKKMDLPDRAVHPLKLKLPKIYLGLVARLRLKPHVGNPLPFLFACTALLTIS